MRREYEQSSQKEIRANRFRRCSGFSLPELMVAAFVMIVVAGFAVPNIMNAVHISRLRASGSNFSGLIESARIRAVQDDRFYSVYFISGAAQEGYVDIYPQSNTGASGNGGTSIALNDPYTVISSEVTPTAASNAPGTSNLKSLFLPTGSSLTIHDGSLSSAPITFGPRGVPCTSQTATGGTVCDSAGGATAFWVFFQDTYVQSWEAITVSPAGRIQKWQYGTSSWSKI